MVESKPGFEEFHETKFDIVARTAHLIAGDRALAEDAAQTAFARAFQRWDRLRDAPWVGGWVMTTALNEVRRQRKRTLREHYALRALFERNELASAGSDRDSPVAAVDLRSALRRLPLRQQQAAILHYVADLPSSEAAQALCCREATVRTHLFRARKALAASLGGDIYENR